MQHLVPLALRGSQQHGPKTAVIRICGVFCKICNSMWNPLEFQALQADVARSMAFLEML